jgi:hypothetical protein
MDAAEYKHVVLGLIFLKYISDAFTEVWLASAGGGIGRASCLEKGAGDTEGENSKHNSHPPFTPA